MDQKDLLLPAKDLINKKKDNKLYESNMIHIPSPYIYPPIIVYQLSHLPYYMFIHIPSYPSTLAAEKASLSRRLHSRSTLALPRDNYF